jgi:hypothetical protein
MIEYKSKAIKDGMDHVHPVLIEIAREMDAWIERHLNIHLLISDSLSTLATDKRLGRVSATHREGRAFDVGGVSNWKKQDLTLFASYFSEKYKHLGALSTKGNTRNFLLAKDSGHGLHCHVQIGRDIVEKMKTKYPNWTYPVEKAKETT